MDYNKPLFFTVVSKLLLKIKQNFSSFIVQFYDSRITKKKLYIILSYNSEVSDGFSHEASSDSDYIPNDMDCSPNRKRVHSDSQSNDEESTSTSQASRQGDRGRGRRSGQGRGRGRGRGRGSGSGGVGRGRRGRGRANAVGDRGRGRGSGAGQGVRGSGRVAGSKKSYNDQDTANNLPPFQPARLPGLHLDMRVTRGAMTKAVDFFQLFFTMELLNEICNHSQWRSQGGARGGDRPPNRKKKHSLKKAKSVEKLGGGGYMLHPRS